MADKSAKYKTEIQQMMFVSGETAEPTAETTTLVEQIVQEQVREMLRRATELANRRGQRVINPFDLMFLYRHDKSKLARLKHFLQWKDVRKNVAESDERGGADAAADLAGGDEAFSAGMGAGGGGDLDPKKTAKRARIVLPWDVESMFSEQVPPLDDEDDDDEKEMNVATLQRLKNADERTKNMSREDYMHWSECRQASFTYRKGKRFREWVGMEMMTGGKPSDDVMDILGFLTFEMVQSITEEALKVKAEEDLWKKLSGGDVAAGKKRKRGKEPGLFDGPEEEREPVDAGHIKEAFRRLQLPSPKQRLGARIVGRNYRQPLNLI